MDRYIVREPRIGADYPQGNQIITFPTNATGNNNVMQPETVYLGRSYAPEFTNMQSLPNSAFMPVQMNAPYTGNLGLPGQIVSGIDPRYLASFGDNNSAQFIVTGQQMQSNIAVSPGFGGDYQNRNFIGADRNRTKAFIPHLVSHFPRERGCEGQAAVASYKNLVISHIGLNLVQTPIMYGIRLGR